MSWQDLASGLSLKEAKNFSMSLLSQSAIAIGLSLIVLDKYPALGQEVNAIILGAVIIFELVGPYLLKRSLEKSGETGQDDRRVDMQLEGAEETPRP